MCRPNTISVYKSFYFLSTSQFSAYMFVTIFSVCVVKRKNGPMCWSCSEINAGVGDFPDIHWDKDWRKEYNFHVIIVKNDSLKFLLSGW